jgi:hypothetical protein
MKPVWHTSELIMMPTERGFQNHESTQEYTWKTGIRRHVKILFYARIYS